MTVGVIFTSFQMADMLSMSLSPWMAAREVNLGHNTFKIACVSCPFTGFPVEEPIDDTGVRLQTLCEEGRVDRVFFSREPVSETEARGQALQWLVGAGVDITIIVDGDEIFTGADIANILMTVGDTPLIVWYRLSLQNLVFDTEHALAEPFTPPRIHRIISGVYKAEAFWDDNNIRYRNLSDSSYVQRDIDMASMTIPMRVAAPKHFSWLSNDRSRRKIVYQVSRGWSCSYRWDEQKGLCFNEQYFLSRGEPLPEVVTLCNRPPL